MFDARIQITCLGCNEKFLVLATEQGHVVECPNCSGFVDVPNLSRPETVAAEDEDRRLAEYARQFEENARQLEENAKQQVRYAQLLDRFEEVIGKLANAVERMNETKR